MVIKVVWVVSYLFVVALLNSFIVAVIMWPYFGLMASARSKAAVVQVRPFQGVAHDA